MRALLLLLLAASAQARVVLLYVDNPSGTKVRAATAEEAARLDEVTDPVLIEKADPDPCVLPPPQKDPRLAVRAKAAEPRSAPSTSFHKLADALKGAAPAPGETISVYGMSWDRLLELRGINLVSFPSEVVLPRWVEKEFGRAMEAIAEKNSETARLLYADLGGKTMGRADWEKLGVEFPADTPPDGAPLFTREDFEFKKDKASLTMGVRAASRPHQVQFFTRLPWTGKTQCPAADTYRQMQKEMEQRQALVLAALTGWPEGHTLSRQGIYPKKEARDPNVPAWP